MVSDPARRRSVRIAGMSRPLHRPIFPKSTLLGCLCLAVVAFPASATAQVTAADYERAAGLREKYEAPR